MLKNTQKCLESIDAINHPLFAQLHLHQTAQVKEHTEVFRINAENLDEGSNKKQ